MKPVMLLLSIGGVFCLIPNDLSYPYDCSKQIANQEKTTLEDVLARASLQAVGAYSQIVQKFSQSLANLKTAIEEWAITYGLEQEYRKIANESERENADYRTAVKELYPILTEFLGNHMKVGNGKKRSLMLAFKRTLALPHRFDTSQQSIFERVIKSYNPSLASSNAGNYGSYAGSFISFPGNSGDYNRVPGALGRQDYPGMEPTEYGGYFTGYQGIGAKYTDAKGYPNNNDLLPRVNDDYSNQWLF
ncbi:unnamed protein product [Cylicocyclus nassatus]|uniref:SXP/RAL-2 family protein Ani s 5-like cation-binding domain-containing protein n=1 Tax=Cylicocyclus nassatus TaxID=53992 RepID=A0AA36MA71_CYLNA|nr:unnamed protein product [Cylicocyclus nassatus]